MVVLLQAGRTALHMAVALDNAVSMDAVVLLLVKGTRIDLKTKVKYWP